MFQGNKAKANGWQIQLLSREVTFARVALKGRNLRIDTGHIRYIYINIGPSLYGLTIAEELQQYFDYIVLCNNNGI